MLSNLVIKNYALIDDLQVNLQSGMTVITGETGAGKSIILGALSLLLGKRADFTMVKDPTKKCVVEAQFNIESYHLQRVFEKNDLDYDAHTIIRREILPGGKSRAFVNDTPVMLSQLQELSPFLIDIHSQHETLLLTSEDFQMEVIDALGKNSQILAEYIRSLTEFKNNQNELSKLKNEQQEQNKELDYNSFLLKELQEANLEEINQEELEEIRENLDNIENIKETIAQSIQILEGESIGSIETSKEVRVLLGRVRAFSSQYEEFWNRLNSVIIELEDLLNEMNNSFESLSANPELLVETNNKLQTLYKLQQKHGLTSVQELLVLEHDLEEKVNSTLGLDNRILELEKKSSELRKKVEELAKTIHLKRIEVIPELRNQLKIILSQLGLPNAQLQFNLQKQKEFRKNGMDSLEMLFSANKGVRPGLLKKVASGGEMSRIMLAIKSILTRYKKLPTLILDEIDTGVSGEIANQMADIMFEMSKSLQVLTITHLPQIAAKGKNHLKIYKKEIGQIANTQLKELNREERIKEIAEMLGGKKISDAALANAKELMN